MNHPNLRRYLFRVSAVILSVGFLSSVCHSAEPAVSNVTAMQRNGTELVDIVYDSSDSDGDAFTVSVEISTNRGASYDLPVSSFTGNGYGYGVDPGISNTIVWDAGADWDGHYSSDMRVRVTAEDGKYPQDPSNTASEVESGVVSLLSSNMAFLYTGSNAIQTGVAAGTIEASRIGVLRGRVLDISGNGLLGVTVTVLDHSELGRTVTRTNGMYDLAVNGGGVLTLNFEKTDYLSSQRTVTVPWQDFVVLDDVVMIGTDSNITTVVLGSRSLKNGMQVAEGSTVTDQDGTRRATVMIPSGTEARIFTEAGVTQSIDTLRTRFTEYTVTTNGPEAMPGPLPSGVAYTYAVELGSLEAERKVDGKDVVFSTNLYFYLENFLDLPVGGGVPSAYYDPDRAAWIPSVDGLVIELMGTNESGLAELDVDGDGNPDSESALISLGFTDEERTRLAATYALTQTLWRVPISHFSTYDLNLPSNWPTSIDDSTSGEPDVTAPQAKSTRVSTRDQASVSGGGVVDLQSQVFRESCPVAGSDLTLNYASDRMPGNIAEVTLDIPLSTNELSDDVTRIDLWIYVGGRDVRQSFAPATNLSCEFSWDSRDAYGRLMTGAQQLQVAIGYVHGGYYALPPDTTMSFGLNSGTRIPGNISSRDEDIRWQRHDLTVVPGAVSLSDGLGGWSLSCHHSYDPLGRTLYYGDGSLRRVDTLSGYVVETVVGTGVYGYSGDDGPATNATVKSPARIASAPDGSYYLVDRDDRRVRKVDPQGVISHFAGCTGSSGPVGDGGPATEAFLRWPYDVDVGPDGSLYIADYFDCRIRKVNSSGIISTVAGNGAEGYSGDGGPAVDAELNRPSGVAVASDGTIYISDLWNHCVRRVGPGGRIHTLAGVGTQGYSGDGGPATNAQFSTPQAVSIGPDGSVYVADTGNSVVRRIAPDGIVHTVAGIPCVSGYSGDGGAATNARFDGIMGVEVRSDGSLYVVDRNNNRVRRVTSDGVVSTIAGDGGTAYAADGVPSTDTGLDTPMGAAITPDGDMLISADGNSRVVRGHFCMPEVNEIDALVASEDARLLYRFSSLGRHLATINALSGSNLYEFGYNSEGNLTNIVDGSGNVLSISRDSAGKATSIRAPDGQRTYTTIDANGYLASVSNSMGESMTFTCDSDGMLTSIVGARGASCTYEVNYDSYGRVKRTTYPLSGGLALGRNTAVSNGYSVAATSAVGFVTTAQLQNLPSGDRTRATTSPDGTRVSYADGADASEFVSYSDGSTLNIDRGPDPRYGMQSPIDTRTILSLPSGLTVTSDHSRSVVLVSGSAYEVETMTNLATVNGNSYESTYDASSREWTYASPEDRQVLVGVTPLGRLRHVSVSGLGSVTNGYDSRGRLAVRTAVGDAFGFLTRTTEYRYGTNGFVSEILDPLGRTNIFSRDATGRATGITFNNGASIGLGYDAQGNMISVTPPGRPAHSFSYNARDALESYSPPSIGGVTNSTEWEYNADLMLTRITRPDGDIVDFSYDSSGHLDTITIPEGQYDWTWQTNGLIGAISSPSGCTITNTYDGSFVTSMRWTGAFTGSVASALDSSMRVGSVTVNDGALVAYGYDSDSLLTNAGTLSITRDALHGLPTGTLAGSITSSIAYNGFGEVTNVSSSFAGSNLLTYSCWYDSGGRVTNMVERINLETNIYSYVYDSFDCVAEVRTNGTVISSYEYDSNGNRTNWTAGGATISASYNDRDQLITRTDSTNTFNAAGELTNSVLDGKETEYGYNALGCLTDVTLPGGTNIVYLHDGLNRRVGRTENGVFTQGFLYGKYLGPVAEYDASTNLVSVFVYGLSPHVPDYMIKGGNTYRIITDRLGGPRIVVDIATGVVAQRLDYDEFGRVVKDTNPGFQPFGFAGGLYDGSTGLLHFGFREYDPVTGRWTRPDPLLFNAGSPNLYAYVMNDPVNYLDPTGLGPSTQYVEDVVDIACFVAGFHPATQNIAAGVSYGMGGFGMTKSEVLRNEGIGSGWDSAQSYALFVTGAIGLIPGGQSVSTALTATHLASKYGFLGWYHFMAAVDTDLEEALGPRGREMARERGLIRQKESWPKTTGGPNISHTSTGYQSTYSVAPCAY